MIVFTFSDEKINVFSLWKVIITYSKKVSQTWVFTESFFHSWFWRNFSTLTKTGNRYGWSIRVIITGNHYLQRVSLLTFTTHNQKRCLKLCVDFTAQPVYEQLLNERNLRGFAALTKVSEKRILSVFLRLTLQDAKQRVNCLLEGDHSWKNTM